MTARSLPARARRATTAAALAAGLAVGLAACSDEAPQPAPVEAETEVVDPFAGVPAAQLPVVVRAAAWAPTDATSVAVTDWDRVRDRLGLPSLTGRSEAEDRARFWREAQQGAVVLTPSVLHEADARLLADFGFTADDVDWQADVTGPGVAGSVLALRPDLPLDGVRRAVAAGAAGLQGARLLADERVLLTGALADAAPRAGEGGAGDDPRASWRTDPVLAELLLATARESQPESVLVRRGCVPLTQALGARAGAGEAARVASAHDLEDFAEVDAWSVAYGDLVATVRLGLDRTDLFERGALVGDWPPVGDPSFADAFGPDPVVDPSTGRLGLMVDDPAAAGAVTRAGVLPWAVCPTPG